MTSFYYSPNQKLAHSVSHEQGVRKTGSVVFARVFQSLFAFGLLLSLVAAASGSTVNCNNNSGDPALIQNALNAAASNSTVTITGTCNLAGSSVTIPSNNLTLNGGATLNGDNNGGGNVRVGSNTTLTGLILNAAVVVVTPHYASNVHIDGNTFQNFQNFNQVTPLSSNALTGSSINRNTFLNIWQGGYINTTSNPGSASFGPTGFSNYCGMDNTTVSGNLFNEVGGDGIHLGWECYIGRTDSLYLHTAPNVVISDNEFIRTRRYPLELQISVDGNCSGGCDFNYNPPQRIVVSGNYAHDDPWPFFPWISLPLASNPSPLYINNTYIRNSSAQGCEPSPAFWEIGGSNALFQGNVSAQNTFGSCPPQTGELAATARGNPPLLFQNNMSCNGTNLTVGSEVGQNNFTEQYDYRNTSTCPQGTSESQLTTSNIKIAFTSANNQSFLTGGNGTWSNFVISNLSIRQVQYFIDGSSTPAITQQLQDVNTNFANDRKWLYHATLNTSSFGGGNHSITAKATDVSGAIQSITQNFVVGSGGGTPKAQVTPASLALGSQTVGLTTAGQTATLSNTGTAALAISNISLGGANASDFSQTSSCGSLLGAGASCTMTVTFTPSATGSRTATLSISDNDSSSPQRVSLSGTGTNPSGGGTPNAHVTPTSLAFGAQSLGISTASQTATLSNTGTAALGISNISLGGANTSDFLQTSTCSSSLGAGASCTLTVTFTPSATGSRTAKLLISDNDSASPQVVSLGGTGMNPSGGGGLPTNLPTGMILWLANNAGVVTNGNGVSAWDDQSGNGNGALQPNAANQPIVVYGGGGQNALSFNGSSTFMSIPSLPIDGATALSVFLVSANSTEHAMRFGHYAFLWWPETGLWGTTYFGSYQTSSHFRFGTGQPENEPSYQMLFTRTNSFGLSEWMHSGTTDSMWLNGQSVASYQGKLQSINNVGNAALLGHGPDNTFYAGDVSEVIVYSRDLNTSERQAIEQYLMKKYHL